jgi:hypothetical protein
MTSRKFQLSRRLLLRGASAAIALPLLDGMLNDSGTALAAGGEIPKRFGTFFWGNGVRPDRWVPTGAGANWALSAELEPLAAVKEYISVLTGMEMKFPGTAHHRGRAGMLAAAYDPALDTYGRVDGPTIDQIAAVAWDGLTPFRSLELGISMRAKGGVNANKASGGSSFSAPGQRIPAEFSPLALFDRLFGTQFNGQDEAALKELALRQSILDTVTEDAKSLRGRLGKVDQGRLDSHLDGIRQLELALASADRACVKPTISANPAVDLGHELLDERNKLMAGILARALACDLTRAFSYEYMGMQADTIFWQVGATEGSHVLTHDDRNLPEMLMPQYEKVHNVVVFVMGQFGYLLEQLKAIPEGNGTLLDNCCIMATSEVNDGTAHSYNSMPLIVAGRAGGKLRSNYHYVADHENTSKALLTCLRAVGLPLAELGKNEGHVTDSIAALEA